jgi:hypothetical protein
VARKRQIDPGIWTSVQFTNLKDPGARLLFIAMFSLADDEGRLKAHPAYLQMMAFPGDYFTEQDILNWRDQIEEQGLIKVYSNGSSPDEYLYLPTFHKHQFINKRYPSVLPPPPDQPTYIEITITDKVRQSIYERDNYTCRYCGKQMEKGSRALSIDHVIPVSKGGSQNIDGIVTACKSCNQKKWQRTPTEAGMTLISLEDFNPTLTPINPMLTEGRPHVNNNRDRNRYRDRISDMVSESDSGAEKAQSYPQTVDNSPRATDPTISKPTPDKGNDDEDLEPIEDYIKRLHTEYFGELVPTPKTILKIEAAITGMSQFSDEDIIDAFEKASKQHPPPKYPLAYVLKTLQDKNRRG